jgi:hypothetical protein
MDHSGAVQIGAERYLLGQLDPQVRDEYEDHYFNCCACAEDVRLTAAFLDNAKPLLQWPDAKRESVASSRSRIFGWLWPMPAGAAAVAMMLLGVVGYQNAVLLPHYREQLLALQSPLHTPSYFLTVARGDSTEILASKGDRLVSLVLSRSSEQTSPYCRIDVKNAAGTVVQSAVVEREPGGEVQITIPVAALKPGTYSLDVAGLSSPSAVPSGEAAHYFFSFRYKP